MKDLRRPGNFAEILPLLAEHGVECILIGGGAGIAHGLARSTYDVDVVYSRAYANLERIANSLLPFHAYLRDMPPGLPFKLDVRTLVNGINFTLSTDLGALDLLGDIPGGGNYQQLVPHSQAILLYGFPMLVLGLEKLIQVKRAAGRPKDLEAVAELQILLDEQRT